MPHSTADLPPTPVVGGSGTTTSTPSRALIPNGDPVLAARFAVPTLPTTFVHRPRLTERLSRARQDPLLLVNGPAGAGKTLLVADWIAGTPHPGPVAWLTVEREDNAPGVFWAYVLEALRHHGVELPADIGRPVRAESVDPSLLARLADHLGRLPTPVLLVLDEFERVGAVAVADALHSVLRHAGPGLRLLVISRTEPLLPLHRYRAAGQITDIRGADLAFTTEEAQLLLGRHRLCLPGEAVRTLTEHTEGWAAGLRLSALAIQQAADPEVFLKEFEAGHSTIADFLLAEVLDTQPTETQDLLLRTSILERIHPALADALTGRQDAEPILERLQHANAFVEPIGRSWYRLHPLFAEILQVHLHARHPGLDAELHRRAARWLAEAGRLTEALAHAAAAGDWAHAADRFVDEPAIGQLFTGLDAGRLDDLFAAMPAEVAGPAPDLVRAARALARYDVEGGLTHLRSAERHLARHGAPAARLSCAFLRVLAARLQGAAEPAQTAAAQAERLQREIPPERLAAHPELPALLLGNLGSVLLWAGRFDAARTALKAALQACEGATTAAPRYDALSRLALIDYLGGRPGRAAGLARQALAGATRCGLAPAARAGIGQLVLAAVAIDRDELPEARNALEQAAVSAAAQHEPTMTVGLAVVRSRLLLAEGDPAAALGALPSVDQMAVGRMPVAAAASPWAGDLVALAAAAAQLAGGDPGSAVRLLEQRGAGGPQCAIAVAIAVATAQAQLAAGDSQAALRILDSLSGGGPGTAGHGPAPGPAGAVLVLLAKAQLADTLGDEAAAYRLLVRALATARPEQLRRPFQQAGPWLRRVLRRRPALAHAHDWLPTELLAELPKPEQGPGPGQAAEALPVEPLSDREHDVLERAAQLMSTGEIAADLCLSVNTVKTHLKSINRKLAASRRGEAVRRARQLHLL
ncbi:LuxR C-terminal-related transcriptional regulator [Kitasatospora sp. NBC_01266]|uniref:LuxR C-terminal-related transcriptional regulator n=1 Tax=Kitasatospora sp. NBC_01266 TaxID=2903572 RepID=UPI002E313556|nr:LuxR C-terminal-related transcriptional regulator [Kitasatospora sp. NBC_01266]